MFLSLSKTFAKVGGFRFGAGIRITKKNAAYMSLVLLFVVSIQLCWYMLVLCFWVMYAILYLMWWIISSMFRGTCRGIKKIVRFITKKGQK